MCGNRAQNADIAFARLEEFEAEWAMLSRDRPGLAQGLGGAILCLRARHPQMNFSTKAVEALHRSLRKTIKTRGSLPNDDAALKLLYLAIKNAGLRWRRGVEWTTAMGQFAIQFGERFPGTAR